MAEPPHNYHVCSTSFLIYEGRREEERRRGGEEERRRGGEEERRRGGEEEETREGEGEIGCLLSKTETT